MMKTINKFSISKLRYSSSGLTLLEIIISTLIFSMIMAGLVNLFVAAKRYTLHARTSIQATDLGKRFLDPVQMDVRQDLWDGNCLSNNTLCGVQGPVNLEGIDYNATTTSGPVGATTLRIINVTLNWIEPQ